MKEINDKLTQEELYVLKDKGTERPFSGEFDTFFEDGVYKCKNCKTELFKSDSKYDAGCGWPSFFEAVNEEAIIYKEDNSIFGRPRTEILCANCEGHLGHVFEDGPKDKTGLRYCVNSISLDFDSENK
ncbi:MAG: peptide-methionine (R)-S-oxide reductase [Amoebophilaceae bacterium TMED152]|nr:peptide-methionine (R)-S-oxide reductase [Gammaproteobacteria bacterium]RPH01319.1 MAG: peptide-methionine (R)-S-oxide reductase [Amoebophilaceae bacterium TMED152]|tara:strand:+ start:12458 stop:12841 length:384 start_codon:yes stop_codon:yes gene_type:complete